MFVYILKLQVAKKNSLRKTVFKMWFQKSTRSTSLVPRISQRLWTLSFFFLHLFPKVFLWTHGPFVNKSETPFSKQFSLNIFLNFHFNLYNCVTKCVTAIFTPWKSKFQALPIWVLKLFFGFQKHSVSVCLLKYTRAIRF